MSPAPPGSAPFPGGTSLTHLKVYDTPAPDGLAGGSPHVHFACTESYLVVNGRGRVQTLCGQGFREVALRPGSVVWFTPGLIHRLINEDGKLELFVVMENAGLPEHGDSILTLPPPHLEKESSYLEVASLNRAGAVFAESEEAARKRRDLAVEGFVLLRQGMDSGSLEAFYDQAMRLIQGKEPAWREIWEAGPMKAAQQTKAFLDYLRAGMSEYLSHGKVFEIMADPERERRKLGFCGTLRTYLAEGEPIVASPTPLEQTSR